MIDVEILITAGIGCFTTVTSGWVSWFFARKKYNSEVDNNLIENMQKSLNFYKDLSEDNKNRLNEVLKRNEELERRDEHLEQEIKEVKSQMFKLMSTICTDLSCQLRKRNMEDLPNGIITK